MYYKFSKPGKWEKGHVQNIGKHDITFNSLNGGGDNGSDIHGTFEGVGRSIKEKYDSLVFNIANKNFKSAIALVGMVSNFFLSFYKLIFGRYFFSIGIKAKNNKNYKKAINYFNKGFQVYPSFSGFLVNLGLIYFDLKDYEKAIVYFDKAIGGGDNNDWLYLKRFEAFYNLGRYYSARMSLNEDILKNPTPKWVMHGKVAMMMRFKGYPFYLIHDGHVKVSRPFNVGGYRAHYKFKELAYNERMVYFRKFIKWNRGCE